MNDKIFIKYRNLITNECKLCGKIFPDIKDLLNHLKLDHNITIKNYYDTYIKTESDNKCLVCNKETKWCATYRCYRLFCSQTCCNNDKDKRKRINETIKKISKEKYGVEHYTQSKEYKENHSKLCIEKWGVASYFATDEFKKNRIKDNQDNYGVDYTFQREDIKNKIAKTKLDNYGDEHYNNRDKAKKTSLELYGDEHYSNRDKCWKTFKEIYGTENIFTLSSIQNKSKNTKLIRYGDETWNNRELYIKTCLDRYNTLCHSKIYCYNDTCFSSSWELAYYIWLKDHNIEFEYQPKTYFLYNYLNIEHRYCPDFKINDRIIEIKGLQFFENHDPTKRMICPYDRTQDDLYEAKHQCMIENNVEIITDCSEYINYINTIYGKDFIEKFRSNKHVSE